MSKILGLLRTKKFWVLLAALVAAFSAFFMSSCTGMSKMIRHGVHHDTVRYEQIIKHKDYLSCKFFLKDSTPLYYQSSCNFTNLVREVTLYHIEEDRSLSLDSVSGSHISPNLSEWCKKNVPYFLPIMSRINSYASWICLEVVKIKDAFMSKLTSENCLSSCSIFVLQPLWIRRNRRGKSRPRPKIKSIPLSGSHF